jgi:hypothetical protein
LDDTVSHDDVHGLEVGMLTLRSKLNNTAELAGAKNCLTNCLELNLKLIGRIEKAKISSISSLAQQENQKNYY